jgi:hypothetical protein
MDSDGSSNRCRLWGSGGLNTVYEGHYVSWDSKLPVRKEELQLSAPADSVEMWVGDSEGKIFAPAALLSNGKVLVPMQVPSACQKFQWR